MTLPVILILIISFIASLVRSTLGFGESLIAVPLFLIFYRQGCCTIIGYVVHPYCLS